MFSLISGLNTPLKESRLNTPFSDDLFPLDVENNNFQDISSDSIKFSLPGGSKFKERHPLDVCNNSISSDERNKETSQIHLLPGGSKSKSTYSLDVDGKGTSSVGSNESINAVNDTTEKQRSSSK